MRNGLLLVALLSLLPPVLAQDIPVDERKDYFVHAVARGAGVMPWQDGKISEDERRFRAGVEDRKQRLLADSAGLQHPVLYSEAEVARVRENVAAGGWAGEWAKSTIAMADDVVGQPEEWLESMIPEETSAHSYGLTCPNCVGVKSQEAVGSSLMEWTHTEPDTLTCRECGQQYPDPAFPETAILRMPRTGQEIAYYLNESERANPDDRTGRLAWHWVGYPIHVSFTGIIRGRKVAYMRRMAPALGLAYVLTGDVRYAETARDVLVRFAHCYRNWLYHDYWDGYADCDPLYAAWHDRSLPLEWKRHLSERAYKKDTLEKAAMMQTFWGAGRFHPSTDSISQLPDFVLAYDLTCAARRADGSPIWTPEQRRVVEADLLLEAIMTAEPYLGGPGAAQCVNNKSPRIYRAMASVAKCLGIAEMADTALRGYEGVRDRSFGYDGFSYESPSYNNMYLSQLLAIPETLHGFEWPSDFTARQGIVDYYGDDLKIRLMYRGLLWSLLPSGHYLPLSDTHVHSHPSDHIVHMGLRRFPGLFRGAMPLLGADAMGEYALFHLSEEQLKEDTGLNLPETCYPGWRTAILRHGSGPAGATAAMPFNRPGGHRHADNLALFYEAGGRTLLGEQGYVGDMPQNAWLRSTKSHNLVVVDDQDQRLRERNPDFVMMATSPLGSVVEAASDAYPQCSEYRRRVVLIKGPDGETLVVDLFRVAGGNRHAFRVYSETATSDVPGNCIEFENLAMPPEPPLPDVGASLAREDIFGLRDVRSAGPPSDGAWTATWSDDRGAFRMWMLSPCDAVEASNGPGQRTRAEIGRRVRYVDAVRTGEDLSSTFAAVYEPLATGALRVLSAERIHQDLGPRSVALELTTTQGSYLVLHDIEADEPVNVAGGSQPVRFRGDFALLHFVDGALRAYLAVGAERLECGEPGVAGGTARLVADAKKQDDHSIVLADKPSTGWPVLDAGAQAYARVRTKVGWTGYPVAGTEEQAVRVHTYPLTGLDAVELRSVRFHERD